MHKFVNFRETSTPDDTVGEARMYSREGDVMCPVTSFKRYLEKLHPEIDALWQRPLDSFNFEDPTWYCKTPLGKNTLGTMMSQISKVGGLSKKYTNHCIRATAITALDDAGIEARHIMRASGHKSESSIRSYACRLSEKKKKELSATLSNVLKKPEVIPVVSSSENVKSTCTPQNLSNICDISQDELNAIFNDENVFQDITPIYNNEISSESNEMCVHSESNEMCVQSASNASSSALNMLNEIKLNVGGNIMSSRANRLNIPRFNITPNMTNCVVNFNFGNGKEP